MTNPKPAYHHEPPPNEGNRIVFEMVVSDVLDRAEMGKKKYGSYLKTNNGRNSLWDAYEEALDLVMYLRQAIMEQEEHD